MEAFGLVFLIIICAVIYSARIESHKDSIENKINFIGGRLINYEQRGFFSEIGPFTIVGKGRIIYRIEYEVDGIKKEGWVRFGGLFGPDWRM